MAGQSRDPPPYASFLVRLGREEGLHKQTAGWHGEIEQVQSGRGSTFECLDDLLSFLRRQVAPKETGQLADG